MKILFLALSILASVACKQGHIYKDYAYGLPVDHWLHWMGGGIESLACAKKGMTTIEADRTYFLLAGGKEAIDMATGGTFDLAELGIGFLGKKFFDYF